MKFRGSARVNRAHLWSPPRMAPWSGRSGILREAGWLLQPRCAGKARGTPPAFVDLGYLASGRPAFIALAGWPAQSLSFSS
jgi:hypothetical protein